MRLWLRGESPEVLFALLFFGVDLITYFVTPFGSGHSLAWAAALCAGAALSGWRPIAAVMVVVLAVLGHLSVAVEDAGAAMFACVVPVMTLVSRRQWRAAAVATLSISCAVVIFTARFNLATWEEWASSLLGWVFVFALAAALGAALGQARRAGELEAQALVEAQRRQIAIDLHDNVSHDLSMIVMRVEQARLSDEVKPEDLAMISEAARRSSRYLRQMMTLLRVGEEHDPEVLDLDETLEASRSRLARRGFDVVLQAEPAPEEMPVAVGDALAKVAKEATNNVLRHGDWRQPCSIMLVQSAGRLELVVSNAVLPGQTARGNGLGLTGMQERMEGVGGRVEILESPRLWVLRASARF